MRAYLFVVMVTFLFAVWTLQAQQPLASQSSSPPLSVSDIEHGLKAGVTNTRMAALVKQYGVDFDVTDAVKKEFSEAGANNDLLLVISRNRQTNTTSASKTNSGMFGTNSPARMDSADTWTDPATGLTWTKSDSGDLKDLTWQQAIDYCKSLSSAGIQGWRLPTYKELQRIYDRTTSQHMDCCSNHTFGEDNHVGWHGEVHVKGDLKLSSFFQWSSSPDKSPETALGLSFEDGFGHPLGFKVSNIFLRALCVHPSADPVSGSSPESVPANSPEQSPQAITVVGLYQSESTYPDPAFCQGLPKDTPCESDYLKFYADGTVIESYMGGPGFRDQVAQFHKPYEKSGAYKIHGSGLRFSIQSPLGTVDYEGEVRGTQLILDWASHITSGSRGHHTYHLVHSAADENQF